MGQRFNPFILELAGKIPGGGQERQPHLLTRDFGSSNFREADILVIKIEALVKEDNIQGQEVFILTENSTFEFTYYKECSSS